MRTIDALLIAPTLFCLVGVVIGVFTDIGPSHLWAGVAAASLAALVLYWWLARAARRPRP